MFLTILSKNENNIFKNMDQIKQAKVKQFICSLILATDMNYHQSLINDLQEIKFEDNKLHNDFT